MKVARIVVLLHQLSLTGSPRLTLEILSDVREDAAVRIVAWEGGPLVDVARRLGPTAVLRREGSAPGRAAPGGPAQVLAGVGSRVRGVIQAAALKRWRPCLVYVSSVEALHMVGKLRLGGVPVVLHVHELGSALVWFEQGHRGLIASVPDRYVAVSEAVARDLVEVMGVPAASVSVVRPYVSISVPARSADAAVPEKRPLVVGGAGKPSWTKGNDLWLLAARDAVTRLGADRLRFVWVGYRDDKAGLEFKTMVRKLKLEDVVELVPETDRPFDHFARFDMFAMSSWEESASLVVLEAMAMRIPVICFGPTGGPSEEVGTAGVVIPEVSPRLLADAIVDLAESPQKRRALGDAGVERARTGYGREASLAALRIVLDSAVR